MKDINASLVIFTLGVERLQDCKIPSLLVSLLENINLTLLG